MFRQIMNFVGIRCLMSELRYYQRISLEECPYAIVSPKDSTSFSAKRLSQALTMPLHLCEAALSNNLYLWPALKHPKRIVSIFIQIWLHVGVMDGRRAGNVGEVETKVSRTPCRHSQT